MFCMCRQIVIRNECLIKNTFSSFKPTNVAPIFKNVNNSSFQIKRNFSINKVMKWFRRPTNKQLYIKDGMPEEYKMIYRSTMERYLFAGHLITLGTSAIGIAFLITSTDYRKELPFKSPHYDYKPRYSENEIVVYITAFVALSVVMYILLSRMPLRIYSRAAKGKKREYVMVFYGAIPSTTRTLTCKAGEIVPVPVKEYSLIPWKDAKYVYESSKNGRQSLIMLEECFRTPADLCIMIGVQRDPEKAEDSDDEK